VPTDPNPILMKLNKRNDLPAGQPQFYLRLVAYSFIRLSEGAYG